MKAVLQFRAGQHLRDRVAQMAGDGVEIMIVDDDDPAGLLREIADAEVLLHVLTPVTAEVIRAAFRLLLIQKIGVGVNTIDLAAAASHGVRVANMPGTNTQAVAEHALALMLAVLRKVAVLDGLTRQGRGWLADPEVLETTGEIAGRTVGFVGFGAVPRRLRPALEALGARVLYHDRQPAAGEEADFRPLDLLLGEADIVSLHLPLTAETGRLMNARAFGLMKRGAVLINTARGGLVDESALYQTIETGHLIGAGLDVFQDEPLAETNPLLTLRNTVLSPHVAWLTPETIERSLKVALENCRRAAAGQPLLHEINLQASSAKAAAAQSGLVR